jgi:1-acyl-sn-glycerol-3-phosphate acyltransferase/CRP-like cAMP-binding protein
VSVADPESLLGESELFEQIEGAHVADLARAATDVRFDPGDPIVVRGEPADALFVLRDGELTLVFTPPAPDAGMDGEEEQDEDARSGRASGEVSITTSRPGFVLGWSAGMDPPVYRATATAVRPTSMIRLERAVLESHAAEHPDFALAFARRMLWIAGARLRSVRLQLVTGRFSTQQEAITSMLAEHAASLPVTSPLHRIPYLLGHRLTVDDALATLDRCASEGEPMERELAVIVREQLHEVRSELLLFRHLQRIYESVASAPPDEPPDTIRRRSLEEFQHLFADTRHVIVGQENLPAEPGHVFVMNHLVNHPDNLLPNDFILTLDTHFVASMVLLPTYGTAPIRVVRRSQRHERGHQKFFDRLGYLYVSPSEPQEKFLETAAGHLAGGRNIVICPEGTSVPTEESPVRFRAGGFRLARHAQPEPLIVPVAVANFDRKLMQTTTVAIVGEPLRVSDHVDPDGSDEQLHDFVNHRVQPAVAGMVRRAVEIADAQQG